jgi:hypothetical protein
MSVLIFIGAILGLIAVAYSLNRIRGVREHYLGDWRPEEGEQVLFRDAAANIFIVGVDRPRFVSYPRPRRGTVIVTDKRILAGTRVLFGRKTMLLYIIYRGSGPDGCSAMIDRGLLTQGYRTLLILPDAVERVTNGKRPYIDLDSFLVRLNQERV